MAWKSPFIIYRVSSAGALTEVFRCDDLKKAKYWLSYIAEPGDVLCKTPAHPKHSKSSNSAEYWSHKVQSGNAVSDEKLWQKFVTEKGCPSAFPDDESTLSS